MADRPTLLGRLGWTALGTVLVLGTAEAGFRGLQLVFDRSDDSPPGGEITILAEGDSFTYGIGGESFPQQLEQILNERAGYRKYRAVNEGVPGLNSAVLADDFVSHLEEHRPGIAIVLIGENNSWNAIRTRNRTGVLGAVDRTLMHSRVYKFFRTWVEGWSSPTFHEADARARAERAAVAVGDDAERIGLVSEPYIDTIVPPQVPPEALEEFLEISRMMERAEYEAMVERARDWSERFPEEANGYGVQAAALKRLNRLEESVEVLERGLATSRFDGTHEELYHALAHSYARLGRLEEADRTWREGLAKFPTSKALYWSYAKHWHDRGDTWHALGLVETLPAIRDNELFQHQQRIVAETGRRSVDEEVSEAFRDDLRRVVKAAREYGVKLIFSSYPDVVYPEVVDVAREAGVPHVDFRPIFAERFTSREEYISPDRCHCNTAGYRVMAETFADLVEEMVGEGR